MLGGVPVLFFKPPKGYVITADTITKKQRAQAQARVCECTDVRASARASVACRIAREAAGTPSGGGLEGRKTRLHCVKTTDDGLRFCSHCMWMVSFLSRV